MEKNTTIPLMQIQVKFINMFNILSFYTLKKLMIKQILGK